MTRTKRYLTLAAVAVAAAGLAACDGAGDEAGGTAGGSGAEAAAQPGAGEAAPELATARFRVDGMTCGGCALATEISVKKLDGVASADASYDEESGEGRCEVEYDPAAVSTEEIAGAIRKAGFEPTLEDAGGADR